MNTTTAYTTAAPTYTMYNATLTGYKATAAPTPFEWGPKNGPDTTVGITLLIALSGLSVLGMVVFFLCVRFGMKKEPGFGMEEEGNVEDVAGVWEV